MIISNQHDNHKISEKSFVDFSLLNFDVLNIVCKHKNLKIETLRDNKNLDILSNYILNGDIDSIKSIINKNYPIDTLIEINNPLILSNYQLYLAFKGDRKEAISHHLISPITTKITNLHLLVLIIFKHEKENLDEGNFKFTQLIDKCEKMIATIIPDLRNLKFLDNEGYSVSDYILMFPTLKNLRLLFNLDPTLKSLSKIKLTEVQSLITNCKQYTDKTNGNFINMINTINTLCLEEELKNSCVYNRVEKKLTKF